MNIAIFILIVVIILIAVYLSRHGNKEILDSAGIDEELEGVYETIKEYDLEAVKIFPKKNPPQSLWSSKFGGVPYWPRESTYPVNEKNIPLILLAQINFEEVPEVKDFPSKGLLQFFIAQDDYWGLEFANKDRSLNDIINDPKGYKVIFHEEIITDRDKIITVLPYTDKQSALPFDGEYSLQFEKTQDRMSPLDYRFEKAVENFDDLDEATIEELYENLDSTGCKLGGYAYFTQEDPRGYADIGDWLLLFQMDSVTDDGVDIMWGDVGVANFFIQPENLKDRDFSRILYNWDCH